MKTIKNVKEIKKNINETKRISQNNIEMLDFHNITQKNQKQELYKMNEQIKLLKTKQNEDKQITQNKLNDFE